MKDSLIGSVVAGYRVEDAIGEGGMGVVYGATDLELARRVALKVIAPKLAGDRVFRERFISESRLAASIEHPAVLPIYRAGESDGVLFLAMRLVIGEDLAQLVGRAGPLAPERAARIVAQLAGALDAAHARGLVHRDVKPGNVLLDVDDRAYLTDFGLAKELGVDRRHTRSGVIVGTPDYVAPEQIQAGPVGPPTDVYALGCVLFFLLTGAVPFPGDSVDQKLWAHIIATPPRPSVLRRDLPAALDQVVWRALAKAPEDRWPTATALATAALQSAARQPAAVAESPGNELIASPDLVGREAHLATLIHALSRATQRLPQIVLIAADAGTGKTRLTREFSKRARASSARVLWGECVPLAAGELPYAPIVAALRALPDRIEVAELIGAKPLDTGADQSRRFELLLGLFRRLGDNSPVILVIEDVHWADLATQDFLRFLARNLSDERLLLVITHRTDEPATSRSLERLLVELLRSQGAQRLAIAPLTPEQTTRQIAAITSAVPDAATVQAVYALSEGNPYFTEELIAARDDAVLPASLQAAFELRTNALSATALRVARVVATAGREVGARVLQHATSLGTAELATALRELVDAHLLLTDPAGETFAFRHALGREGFYRDLFAAERRELHATLARAIAEVTPEPDRGSAYWAELANHWHQAEDRPAALQASIAAATGAAAVYAFGAARYQLERARELWPCVPPERRPDALDEVELLRRLSEATRLAGDWRGALETATFALDLVDAGARPQVAADLHELLGRLHRAPEAAIREFDCALRLLPDGPSAQRASLIIERTRMRQYGQWPSTVLPPALEALAIAEAANAHAEAGRAHEQLGKQYTFVGEPDRGIEHYRRAIEIAKTCDRPEDMATAITNLGSALIMLGRIDAAFAHLEAGLDEVRDVGLASAYGAPIEAQLADCESRMGHWAESRQRLERLLRTSQRNEDARLLLLGLRLSLDAREGRFEIAAACEREALQLLRAEDLWPQTVVITNCARAELALLRGDPDAAAAIVTATRQDIFCGDLLWWPTLLTFGLRAEADRAVKARAHGRDDLATSARVVAGEILGSTTIQGTLRWARFERPTTEPAPPETLAHHQLGEAELARLEGVHRPELWVKVAARWDALGYGYQASYARIRAAEAQLGRGETCAAADTLLNARTVLAQLGAAPLLRLTSPETPPTAAG